MKKVLVALVVLVSIAAFAFVETAVQIYVKIYVDLVATQETKTETFIDGQLVDRKVDKKDIKKDSFELWVMGSGTIIWSGETPTGIKTLIMTNYHVIEYAVEDIKEFNMNDSSILVMKRENMKLQPFRPQNSGYRIVITGVSKPHLIFYWSWKRTNKQVYEVPCEVEKYDPLLDIAILKLDNVSGLPYAKFAKTIEDYPVGSEIAIFGAPLGVPFQLTKGTLGQKHLDIEEGWYDMLRYDCPQAPGSSGSGIFSVQDKILIGVVRGSFVNVFGASYDGQHVGISVDNIKDWLILSGYQFLFVNSK